MRHILYIINPISGTQGKTSLRELVVVKTKAAGIKYSIYPSVASGVYSYLFPVIKDQGVTDVVIAGGDGTVNAVVNALRAFDVQFGIIPMGSGNGLAFSAGIPKAKEKALNIIFNGKSGPTDAFEINGQFACMLCGLGFDAQVAHDFAADPRRGLSTYIRKVVNSFFTAGVYPFHIRAGEEELSTEAFFISVANSNQFGNQFIIAPQASLTDGLLDIVVVTAQNKFTLLLQTLRQVRGLNKLREMPLADNKGNIIYFQTSELRILNPSGAPMHIDGDPVESMERLDIKVLPDCYRLIYP